MANSGDSNVTRQAFPYPPPPFPSLFGSTQNQYAHQVGSFPFQSQFLTLESMDPRSGDVLAMSSDAAKSMLSNGSSSGCVTDGQSKVHRRSMSDVPIGFAQPSTMAMDVATTPLTLWPPVGYFDGSSSGKKSFDFGKQHVKQEFEWDQHVGGGERMGDRKSEGNYGEDLFSAYLNFGGFDPLNGGGRKQKSASVDGEGNGNGDKTYEADSNGSEEDSCGNGLPTPCHNGECPSTELKVETKMTVLGEPGFLSIVPPRHGRSLSMDSFMMKMSFGSKPYVPPTQGLLSMQPSSYDSQRGAPHMFSLEFGNGEFTAAEMEKIVANEKLAEIAMSDPKRVKRILANRLSAARSKERKMRYISELEHKVQCLQNEISSLATQVTLMQRDSTGFTTQNNELKFRLQAMEQQAQLKDALNEALSAEVQRLKLAAAKLGDARSSSGSSEQHKQNNGNMFQQQQQQKSSSRSIAEDN